MIFVIIWVACGFGAAAIAKSKNKDSGTWFLLGVLLGPLALLIVGFMKAEEPEVDLEEATDRIAKLKMMGDADALAGLIANETDPRVCRDAAEALVELDDERGKKYLENAPSIEPEPEEPVDEYEYDDDEGE